MDMKAASPAPRRPTKGSIERMKEQVMEDLSFVRSCVMAQASEESGDEAMAGLETFVNIALRVMAETNASKLASIMRTVEIHARMSGATVYE